MIKFILKRLLHIIPVFIVITFVVFGMLSFVPGDPVLSILGPNATDHEIEELNERLGLNKPFFIRYGDYMLNMFKGDLGISWLTGNDVFDEFMSRIPNSLTLDVYAIILTIAIGIPLGILAAVRQYSITDKVTLVFALIFASVPAFWVAMMAQVVFAVNLDLLPTVGADSFAHFVLPAATLSVAAIAQQVRMTRASMLDVLQQDYIRTAKAKGGTKMHIIVKHAMRNALLPVVTGIGNSFVMLISGAVVIELVFAIPGIGTMLINAVRTRDVPMVMGPVIFVALFVCIVNLIVDIIYAFIDPRVRLSYSKR